MINFDLSGSNYNISQKETGYGLFIIKYSRCLKSKIKKKSQKSNTRIKLTILGHDIFTMCMLTGEKQTIYINQ